MTNMFRLACAPVAALLGVVFPLAAAVAQQAATPIAVVSLASVNENLADVAYLTRAAGMPDYGDTARFFAGALANGIDKARPSGLYVIAEGAEFPYVGFLPLEPNGLAAILKVHKDQLGEPKDVGNGILQIGNRRTFYVKEQNGWAFLADNKAYLANLPADPAALLGDLPKTYNVAAKLLVQNVPAEARQMVIDELKFGIERILSSPAARQGNFDREQAQQLTAVYLTNLERLMKEANDAVIGLAIDEAAKHIALDVSCSAKEGTGLARTMALQADARTNFAGFLLPEAAVTFVAASKLSPEDIEQMRPALKAARGQWTKQIDDSPDIPAEKREAIKGILGQFVEIVENTLATGKSDAGGVLLLLPRSVSFAFGGAVADGAAVEKLLKSIADTGRDVPNFPTVKLNSGNVGDMRLHQFTMPLPNGNPQVHELLGDQLRILVGVAPKSVIVTGGKDADGLLHKVLERSKQQGEQAVKPVQFVVSLLPILQFSKSVSDNPLINGLVSSLEQSGNDKLMIETKVTPKSSQTRIEIQEGIIKTIGEGVKRAGAGFGRGGR